MVAPRPCTGDLNRWLNPRNHHFLPRLRACLLCKTLLVRFYCCLLNNSSNAAPILRAPLLLSVEVCSLMLAAKWSLKNLGFFLWAPLLTLWRHVWDLRLYTVSLSIWQDILCSSSSTFAVIRERFLLSLLVVFSIYGGCTPFKLAGKLQFLIYLFFHFSK